MDSPRTRSRFIRLLSLLSLALPSLTTIANDDHVQVGNFSQGSLTGWQEKSFVGNTQYELVDTKAGKVLKASAQSAASGLFKEQTIDLAKTPYLNWSWRVNNTYQNNDERSKQGDDYPARIYVVVSGGVFFWRTRAINYVWSSNQTIGAEWDNAYTENAKMIAVRSGDNSTGQWLSEKRNVKTDLQELFGEKLDEIHAIAVMTDSDNTEQKASAFYGDIFFSAE